jgi:spore maturation protein A
MLNIIWPVIMIFSIITAFFTGNAEAVASAAMTGAGDGVSFTIELLGIMCFWTGRMKIAEKCNLISVFAGFLRPITKLIFPDIRQNSPAMDAIVMNMTANMLGMSNAATPLGLRAMGELQKLSGDKKRASNSMCRFVIINTASIQILPATLIAIRSTAGSAAPSEIIVPIWITSVCAVLVGLLSSKAFEMKHQRSIK